MSADASPRFTFKALLAGNPWTCVVSLSKPVRLTGPFSAGPSANHSPESFHCSAEQQVPLARGIDFHSWCDSATITSLFKKLHWFLMYCVCLCGGVTKGGFLQRFCAFQMLSGNRRKRVKIDSFTFKKMLKNAYALFWVGFSFGQQTVNVHHWKWRRTK